MGYFQWVELFSYYNIKIDLEVIAKMDPVLKCKACMCGCLRPCGQNTAIKKYILYIKKNNTHKCIERKLITNTHLTPRFCMLSVSDFTWPHRGILGKFKIPILTKGRHNTVQEHVLVGFGILKFLRILQEDPLTLYVLGEPAGSLEVT